MEEPVREELTSHELQGSLILVNFNVPLRAGEYQPSTCFSPYSGQIPPSHNELRPSIAGGHRHGVVPAGCR
jgi:hypothetical protein